MKSRKLNKAQISEIKDLYDGSFSSIRELVKLFKVGETCIRWIVNHKDFCRKQTKLATSWKKANPEKVKLMAKKAAHKYHQSEKGRKRDKLYYKKNREKIMEDMRLRYKRLKRKSGARNQIS